MHMSKFLSILKKSLISFVFASFVFIVGNVTMLFLLIGADLEIENKISLNVDLFDLLSLFVTALLAIYVTTELTKRVQDNRSVKDIAIKRLEKLENLMTKKLRQIYKKPELDFVTKALNNFREKVRNEHQLLTSKNLISSTDSFIKLIETTDLLWNRLLLIQAGGGGEVTFDEDNNSLVFSEEVKEFIIQTNNKISQYIFDIQSDISTK